MSSNNRNSGGGNGFVWLVILFIIFYLNASIKKIDNLANAYEHDKVLVLTNGGDISD